MRLSFVRWKLIAAAVMLAAAAATGAGNSAQAAQKVQVPAAPAGGLDYTKLPDVVGIHLGMPVKDAVAVVKAKWPADRVKVFYARWPNSTDAPWITRVSASKPGVGNNQGNSVDDITVFFNAPPNPQVVVQISRTAMMVPPTAIGNLVAALRQKYGHEMKPPLSFDNMAWEFNEQGQPVPMPMTYICTSFNQPANGMDAKLGQPADVQLFPPFVQPIDGEIPRLYNMCKDAITVTTLTNPKLDPNQMVSSSTVIMIEHAEDLRDYIASSRYAQTQAAAAAAKQKQEGIKKATPAPKL